MEKDVVDLFEEEIKKREFKDELKMAKNSIKEKKKKKKKEKKLEKLEDIEFAKKLEEKKSLEDDDILNKIRSLQNDNSNEILEKEKKYPFLNFLLTISILILLVCSIDYAIYNIIKEKDFEIILTSSFLCIMVIFYILSIIINKKGIKKFFEILATISFALYMGYYLFIV